MVPPSDVSPLCFSPSLPTAETKLFDSIDPKSLGQGVQSIRDSHVRKLHRLQLGLQHNHPRTAHSKTGRAGEKHLHVLLGFLTWRPQAVRVSRNTCSDATLNTCRGISRKSAEPLPLHFCNPLTHSANLFITDEATVMGLISNNETDDRSWGPWPCGAATINSWVHKPQKASIDLSTQSLAKKANRHLYPSIHPVSITA